MSVVGTSFSAKLNDINGIRAELIGSNGSALVDLDQGVVHDGSLRVSRWADANRPQSAIVARLTCHTTGRCANQVNGTKAFMEVNDASFIALDTVRPTLSLSGTLWVWMNGTGYHRASAELQASAADVGSGVASVWAEVNGLRAQYPDPACPGDRGVYSSRFTPCEASVVRSRSFDTSQPPFQEGANNVRVCASDFADLAANANTHCSVIRRVLVDNRAPAPPLDLRVEGGSEWRTTNGFRFSWEIPAGQTSPIAGIAYAIRDLETGSQVSEGYVEQIDGTELGPIEVPGPGAYRVAVSLVDSASNRGLPAEAVVRFDDRPPGDVNPLPAPGWVSVDELPIRQEIERAEAGGPSGVAGYALDVSSSAPGLPCASGTCLSADLDLAGGADTRTGSIGGLTEGSHWISAVAVSGARKPSLEAGSTVVKVDRTFPEATISGVPPGWVNHPVTVTVRSTDSLSGMLPDPGGDDGTPATFVAAESQAPYESPGDTATFTVATEGVNRIEYWAEDLAGNAGDGRTGPDGLRHPAPGSAVARIDLTEPSGSFVVSRDTSEPERVELVATDLDSGVASARIGIRRAGSGAAFSALPTTREGDSYVARVPSDDLEVGSYELSATVEDRAGNFAVVDRRADGGAMVLEMPLKQRTKLTAGFAGGKLRSTIGYGTQARIEGRLTSGDRPLADQPLSITETMTQGAALPTTVATARTDGDGRYSVKLPAGTSRSAVVSFAGSPTLSRATSGSLELMVKGRTRFRLKRRKVRNGAAVKMSGRVGFAGALRPARGKLVAIQYFDPSRRQWRPVEVLRTRRSGRFAYRYRFRTIASAQKFLFRAVALPEAGWPYLPSTSRPRSVIVYPSK